MNENQSTDLIQNQSSDQTINDNSYVTDENGLTYKIVNGKKVTPEGYVIDEPEQGDIVLAEDPFLFEVEELGLDYKTNSQDDSAGQSSAKSSLDIGTEQSGNITF